MLKMEVSQMPKAAPFKGRRMVFILEGPDKCGKTTLARKLCERYNATYLKFSAPKGDAYTEDVKRIIAFLRTCKSDQSVRVYIKGLNGTVSGLRAAVITASKKAKFPVNSTKRDGSIYFYRRDGEDS